MKLINNHPNLLELDFYSKVIDRMMQEVPGDYDVVIVSDPPDEPFKPLPVTDGKKVVFSFSDEKNRLPDYAADKDVVVVFKAYSPFTPASKLCPIPMSYMSDFKPLSVLFERRYQNFYFSGHSNGGSRKELQKVSQTMIFPDSTIKFTESFGAGSKAEYARMLGSSKFALCPAGNNPETFRHIEAAMSGCVVISDHQPAHWYNADVPFVYLNSWTELPAIFDFFAANPGAAIAISQKTLDYYNKFLSLDSVVKVCVNTLRHELNKKNADNSINIFV